VIDEILNNSKRYSIYLSQFVQMTVTAWFSGTQPLNVVTECEISSSHSGEYEVQICFLGCTAV
jgi:hypothetical protein